MATTPSARAVLAIMVPPRAWMVRLAAYATCCAAVGCTTAASPSSIMQMCAGTPPDRYPSIVKLSATIDNAPGMTFLGDPHGAYADDSLACVAAQQQRTGLTQIAFPVSTTYGCNATNPHRTLTIDLTHPVPGGQAISLGLVQPTAANIIVIPSVGVHGYVGLTDLPVGAPQSLQVFALVNRDNGDRLAFAPHGVKGCGPFLPGPFPGTTEARVVRRSARSWEITLPAGSIGELYQFARDAPPVMKGLYYFQAHIIITTWDSLGHGIKDP